MPFFPPQKNQTDLLISTTNGGLFCFFSPYFYQHMRRLYMDILHKSNTPFHDVFIDIRGFTWPIHMPSLLRQADELMMMIQTSVMERECVMVRPGAAHDG